MSIKKDLISIIFIIMLPVILYQTSNLYVVLICIVLLVLMYVDKNIEMKKLIQKKSNEQRQFFTEILMHDLKTPTLAQIRGIELLQSGKFGHIDDEQKEILGQIKESGYYVLEMISKVLRIYRLGKDFSSSVSEKVNMEELLLQSFEKVDIAAKEKNIEFVYLASGVSTELRAEKKDIRLIIENLLRNSILYSNIGEKIFIKFENFSNNLKFEIITKGIILTEKECKKMFNISIDKTPSYSIIGQDISLHLCKVIADCYNGKIYVQSDGEMYNKFTLELPVSGKQEEGFLKSLIMSY